MKLNDERISQYDRDTVAYLRAVGAGPALLARVERLVLEVAKLKAEREQVTQ